MLFKKKHSHICSDFEKQDVARYGEYFKLIELAVMEYKERMSTDPICASFLSLVVALLQPWPPARVSLR